MRGGCIKAPGHSSCTTYSKLTWMYCGIKFEISIKCHRQSAIRKTGFTALHLHVTLNVPLHQRPKPTMEIPQLSFHRIGQISRKQAETAPTSILKKYVRQTSGKARRAGGPTGRGAGITCERAGTGTVTFYQLLDLNTGKICSVFLRCHFNSFRKI